MSGKIVLGAAALFASAASAANVNVQNQCTFDVQVTPSHSGTDESQQTVKAGATWTRPISGDAWCLKMYGPGATNPTQLEWSVAGSLLFYDISDIDMKSDTTFLQYGMSLESKDPSCQDKNSPCRKAVCPPSKDSTPQPCKDTYNEPWQDQNTHGASASYDLDMILCDTGNGAQQPANNQGQQQPGQQPQQPAQQQPAQQQPAQQQPGQQQPNQYKNPAQPANPGGNPVHVDNNGNAYEGQQGGPVVNVVQTEVVTQIVTARDAEATAPIMRRHMHHPHGRHH